MWSLPEGAVRLRLDRDGRVVIAGGVVDRQSFRSLREMAWLVPEIVEEKLAARWRRSWPAARLTIRVDVSGATVLAQLAGGGAFAVTVAARELRMRDIAGGAPMPPRDRGPDRRQSLLKSPDAVRDDDASDRDRRDHHGSEG